MSEKGPETKKDTFPPFDKEAIGTNLEKLKKYGVEVQKWLQDNPDKKEEKAAFVRELADLIKKSQITVSKGKEPAQLEENISHEEKNVLGVLDKFVDYRRSLREQSGLTHEQAYQKSPHYKESFSEIKKIRNRLEAKQSGEEIDEEDLQRLKDSFVENINTFHKEYSAKVEKGRNKTEEKDGAGPLVLENQLPRSKFEIRTEIREKYKNWKEAKQEYFDLFEKGAGLALDSDLDKALKESKRKYQEASKLYFKQISESVEKRTPNTETKVEDRSKALRAIGANHFVTRSVIKELAIEKNNLDDKRGGILDKITGVFNNRSEKNKKRMKWGMVAGTIVITGGAAVAIMAAKKIGSVTLEKVGLGKLASGLVFSTTAAGALAGGFVADRGARWRKESNRRSGKETIKKAENIFSENNIESLQDELYKHGRAVLWYDHNHKKIVATGAVLGGAAGLVTGMVLGTEEANAVKDEEIYPDSALRQVQHGLEVPNIDKSTGGEIYPDAELRQVEHGLNITNIPVEPEELEKAGGFEIEPGAIDKASEFDAPPFETSAPENLPTGVNPVKDPDVVAPTPEEPQPPSIPDSEKGELNDGFYDTALQPMGMAEPTVTQEGYPKSMTEIPVSYTAESGDNFWDIMEGQTNAPEIETIEEIEPSNKQTLIDLVRDHVNAMSVEERAELGFGKTADSLAIGAEVDMSRLNEIAYDIAEEKGMLTDMSAELDSTPETSLRPEPRPTDLGATESAPEESITPMPRPESIETVIPQSDEIEVKPLNVPPSTEPDSPEHNPYQREQLTPLPASLDSTAEVAGVKLSPAENLIKTIDSSLNLTEGKGLSNLNHVPTSEIKEAIESENLTKWLGEHDVKISPQLEQILVQMNEAKLLDEGNLNESIEKAFENKRLHIIDPNGEHPKLAIKKPGIFGTEGYVFLNKLKPETYV